MITALSGCQTLKPISKKSYLELNEHKDEFEKCTPTDGSINLTLTKKESVVFSEVVFDYIVSSKKEFKGHILNPLGGVEAKIYKDKSDTSFSWTPKGKFKKLDLSLDKENFLSLNDSFVGVKLSEIGCFLKYKWPKSWLKKFRLEKTKENYSEFIFDDQGREVILKYSKTDKAIQCSRIKWSYFLGIYPKELLVCLDSKKQQGSIYLKDQFSKLTWVAEDEYE